MIKTFFAALFGGAVAGFIIALAVWKAFTSAKDFVVTEIDRSRVNLAQSLLEGHPVGRERSNR